MLTPHRRNPSRRRQAPKRYEDEKFVSGRIDQYTRGYEGRDSNWRAAEEDAENYYNTKNGRKFLKVSISLLRVSQKNPGGARDPSWGAQPPRQTLY